MPVAVRQVVTTKVTPKTTKPTFNLPAYFAGDVWVAEAVFPRNADWGVPAGWTQIGEVRPGTTSTQTTIRIWTRIPNGTEGTSVITSTATATSRHGTIHVTAVSGSDLTKAVRMTGADSGTADVTQLTTGNLPYTSVPSVVGTVVGCVIFVADTSASWTHSASHTSRQITASQFDFPIRNEGCDSQSFAEVVAAGTHGTYLLVNGLNNKRHTAALWQVVEPGDTGIPPDPDPDPDPELEPRTGDALAAFVADSVLGHLFKIAAADPTRQMYRVRVHDRIPTQKAQLRTDGGRFESVYKFESSTGSLDVEILTGGILRFDETIQSTWRIEVLGDETSDTQTSVNARINKILMDVLYTVASQKTWDFAALSLDQFDYFWITPGEVELLSSRLEGSPGAAAGVEISFNIRARRTLTV